MSPKPPDLNKQTSQHPQNLPEPIVVKDCRPHNLPSSSPHDMQNFLNFGGGANPMAYKGYTFSKQGRFQFHPSQSTAVSPSVQLQPKKPYSTTHQPPSFQFYKHHHQRPAPPPEHHLYIPQDGPNLCCPLIGPVTPLFAMVSFEKIATSSLLSPNIYLSWRIIILVFSLAALGFTAAENLTFITTPSGIALCYSSISAFIMLARAIEYRLTQHDHKTLTEHSKAHGVAAIFFQGNSHVCFIAGIAAFLIVLYRASKPAFIAASYFQSSSVYLLLIMAILHLIDICFTPVPFRLLNTLPIYTLMNILLVFSLIGSTAEEIITGSVIMFGSSLGIGFLLHLYARGILFAVHNNAMRSTAFVEQEALQP